MAIGTISTADVRIVVLGDPDTGKSTMIASIMSEIPPKNIQKVLQPTLIPEDFYPDRVPLTIIDTDCCLEDRSKLAEVIKDADAIILTYSCDQPQSFSRLSTMWLQELRQLQVKIPIIVVGCKLDLKEDAEQVSMEQIITPVMQQYREIETCLECSAFSQIQVHEVFYYAQKAALHPTGPLYDQETRSLKPKCARALKRIFYVCDHDMDGALNDGELNELQVRCFSSPMQPTEITGMKRVVQENITGGVNQHGITLSGFIHLHTIFIEKGSPETTWMVLRKFGYDNDLKLGNVILPNLLKRSHDQTEHQRFIADAGALPHLVELMRKGKNENIDAKSVQCVHRRAAEAIGNLAHENSVIKNHVRIAGGIPPLVELLESNDMEVQKASAAALRTIAFENSENKAEILKCNALPKLIIMLQFEDASIHSEAIGVIGNLVHSSPDIKKEVLQAGALQPVISLLSSSCSESQREAALLIGQFASTDSDCKVHIVQRGALRPLVDMLYSPDLELREMSSFALGRLAQNSHNQAGIGQSGAVVPLLKFLDLRYGSVQLQHNAAFALFGISDNEDNISTLIKHGAVQKLKEGVFVAQQTVDCVAKILHKLEEKIQGRVLNHLLHLICFSEKNVQQQVALALAHLCSSDKVATIFVDNHGLLVLLDLLESSSTLPKQKQDACMALHYLSRKVTLPFSCGIVHPSKEQVCFGEQYINNPSGSDVIFLIEGKRFYAHRSCLTASSSMFRAMFGGGFMEEYASTPEIEIPNIKWWVFHSMIRFIYSGSVTVDSDMAPDLLKAADHYLMDDLKLLCENTIAQEISVDNVSALLDLSEEFHALSLRDSCVLFTLRNLHQLNEKPWFSVLMRKVLLLVRDCFTRIFAKIHTVT